VYLEVEEALLRQRRLTELGKLLAKLRGRDEIFFKDD
jgi:hypothetical protein